MRKTVLVLAFTILAMGSMLSSCSKDDLSYQELQIGMTYDEVVQNLPGVYLSADYYDEAGYGRVVWLKEDGTTEHYYFFDNNVEDEISVDEFYSAEGTWKAFKVDDIPSGTGICSKLMYEGYSGVEVDSSLIYYFEDKIYIRSNVIGVDEFFKVSQTFEEFKEELVSFLPEHLDEKDMTKESAKEHRVPLKCPDNYKCWMRDLPDDVYLRDLSIPGSHDAFSYRCYVEAQAQTLNAEKQFNWGVRWFDIRYYWSDYWDKALPCHGQFGAFVKTYSIERELKRLEDCVTNNPTEGVIIRFKLESNSDMPQTEKEDKKRKQWLKNYLIKHSDLYIPATEDMTLSQIRGKIAVMDASGDLSGTPYDCLSFEFDQDECDYDDKDRQGNVRQDFAYIKDKTDKFRTLIEKHRVALQYSNGGVNVWTINHCSGYLKTYRPVEFASKLTPELGEILGSYATLPGGGIPISGTEKPKITFGVVPMDFIGRSKVKESRCCMIMDKIPASYYEIRTPDITAILVESNKFLNDLPQQVIKNYFDMPFTVGENGDGTPKIVNFTKGNMYFDKKKFFDLTGSGTFGFDIYLEQTDYSPTFPPEKDGELTHFTWGYGKWSWDPSDNRYQESAFTDWGEYVLFGNKEYSTLSNNEWIYLLNERKIYGSSNPTQTNVRVTLDGVDGLLIYADDYKGTAFDEGKSFTSKNFPQRCIFLPFAGRYEDGSMIGVGDRGYYWTSSDAGTDDNTIASALAIFGKEYGSMVWGITPLPRNAKLPVRLVRRVQSIE